MGWQVRYCVAVPFKQKTKVLMLCLYVECSENKSSFAHVFCSPNRKIFPNTGTLQNFL
jgi:hypothetical protein